MDGFEYWLQRSVQVCIAWSSGASQLQDAREMVGNEYVSGLWPILACYGLLQYGVWVLHDWFGIFHEYHKYFMIFLALTQVGPDLGRTAARKTFHTTTDAWIKKRINRESVGAREVFLFCSHDLGLLVC